MVRPGSLLSVEDALLYTLIVGKLHTNIRKRLEWSQGTVDVAYQLQEPSKIEWLKGGFSVWRQMREMSLDTLKEGFRYVVVTDITGFYENIDISRLVSELRETGADEELVNLLSKCLNKWAHPRGKGIPQGYSASDILAKLYLEPLDKALTNKGMRHYRYVDDLRVFCTSHLDAKRSIEFLTSQLSIRGLNLQSAKTKILSREEAKSVFDGVTETIEALNHQVLEEIADGLAANGYVFERHELVRALQLHKGPPPETLERAFVEQFLETERSFDKTLFTYLLRRLGKCRSVIAAEYCMNALSAHPEHTEDVLEYLRSIGPRDADVRALERFAASSGAYEHQQYLIIRWFFENDIESEYLLFQMRVASFDRNKAKWLRSYALAYLGRYGDQSDLDLIEGSYQEASSEIEKAEIVGAVSRMERTRRNAFYARISDDGPLVGFAVRFSKAKATSESLNV